VDLNEREGWFSDHRHENTPKKRSIPSRSSASGPTGSDFPLQGKATMFIEGEGEFPLGPGMVVMVPPNGLHSIWNVKEDVILYNALAPAIPFRPGKK